MSEVGTLREVAWFGGEHNFRLAPVGLILALEESCKAGIATIHARLSSGNWYINDIRETIRLGLIGAGTKTDEAVSMVKTFVDGNPSGYAPSGVLAIKILEAAIIGVRDDPVGKKKPEADAAGSTSSMATDASEDRPSSEWAPA